MALTGEEVWQKKKVCIVDDDENLREIYSTKFNAEGFEVLLAEDGEIGLGVIREKKPDIVLLDIQMPVKDGLTVLGEMQADQELRKIPVIMLTNVDDEETIRAIGKFETRFYLIKSLTSPQKAVDYVREVI